MYLQMGIYDVKTVWNPIFRVNACLPEGCGGFPRLGSRFYDAENHFPNQETVFPDEENEFPDEGKGFPD